MEDRHEEIQLVVFRVGREEYGLDIRDVREIIKMQQITEIPNAPPFVEGVINLRGQITPVVDMRRRLGSGTELEQSRDTRIVIVETERSNVGIIVDSVVGVTHVPRGDISPPPVGENEFVRGVGKVDGRLLILLDLHRLLEGMES